MRTNKQKLLLAAKILLAVLLLVVGGFIFFRDSLLNQALDKVSTKMTQQYNSNFTVKKASFDGLNGIDLYDVVLAPKNADTLLNIKKLKTSISFWNLFIGNIQLQSLELQEGYIQLVKKGKVKNFDAFLKKDEELNLENSDSKTDYAATAYRMISRLLNLIPTDMSIEKLAFKIDDNGKKANIKTTASGLQYEVLKEGNATKPKATDIVAVQYEGKLLDGKVFDSTAQHGGQPAVFPLNQVIPGWTEGLQLMGEGAKYRFYIPSNLAYGEQGAPQGGIEPNSVLIFDVELVKVNPPAEGNAVQPSAQDIQAQLQQQIEAAQQQQASQPAQ